MPEFSKKQTYVIESRDANLLVSAAAGSGKTTVLVHRILSRIMDTDNPVNIDEILVLTFTIAAAGEMKDRIANAIREEIIKQPGNEHLKKQSLLIYNAQISTIDSFALSILKNNFAEIGLEPGFRPALESEIVLIKEEVLDKTIEDVLNSRDIEYLDETIRRFSGKANLDLLKSVIVSLYENAENAPFVMDYLEDRRKDYSVASREEFVNDPMYIEAVDECLGMLDIALEIARRGEMYAIDCGIMGYANAIAKDIESMEKCLSASAIEDKINVLRELSFSRASSTKSDDKENVEKLKQIRDSYKKLINEISAEIDFDIEETIEHYGINNRCVNCLISITERFVDKFNEEKRRRGLITFSDMEHLALQILLNKEGNRYVPSSIAKEYRAVYKEIMIDEYQDSNYIQEALIGAISGEEELRFDRFMVGDIKQSIYRFRNANPELFMEKYNEYSTEATAKRRRIDLSTNYRSRMEVIDSVNAVFERVMDEQFGNVTYDEAQRLNFGADYYPENGVNNKTEFRYLTVEDCEAEGIDKAEAECMLIASTINELMGSHRVYESDKKAERSIRYRDIVVLLRNSSLNSTLKTILDKQGIPSFITSKTGYFDTKEITTIINYLRVINNPNDDIAMFGSLTSLFGDMSDEDIAILRGCFSSSLYSAMTQLITCDIDALLVDHTGLKKEELIRVKEKSEHFLLKLKEYCHKSVYTPVHELIREIIYDSDYMNYMGALPMGEQRCANIRALLGKAAGFEEDGFRGLFNFIRMIEKIRKYKTDEGEVVTLDENADVVRIMTMHGSKGLEFPVCILGNLAHNFNMTDSKAEVIFHNRYGLGMNYINCDTRARYEDFRKKFIAGRLNIDTVSEEIRLLYVAMTRAKEKLIMTAVSGEEKIMNSKSAGPISFARKKGYNSFMDILLSCRLEDDWNGSIELKNVKLIDIMGEEVNDILRLEDTERELKLLVNSPVREKNIINNIRHEYAHSELEGLVTKTSVSELKMAAMHLPEVEREDMQTGRMIPQFENGKGAEVGSAYHRIMELIDYRKITDDCADVDIKCLDDQMSQRILEGKLSDKEYSLVDKSKIIRFINSDIGKRIRRAAYNNNLYREQPFVLGIAAKRLNDSFPDNENVLIQGIIDLFFIEDGKIILLDYKTDNVAQAEDLISRYHTQLDYYEESLQRINNMPVSEKLIYSFKFDTLIKL